MASSNVPDDVCSVCLEPYKGRNPKLLPCFHTLCLPCLKDLEKHHMEMSPDTTVGEEDKEETKPLTFPCPTCRAVIIVPPGGVTQFQTNFYLIKNTFTCDICDKGEDAVSTCTECGDNMCVTCQRYHNKLASSHQVQPLTFNYQQVSKINIQPVKEGTIAEQLTVLEEALVTMREEEDTLQRERQSVADVITRRADAVRALVTQVEERSNRVLAEVVESLGKQIQQKIITARDWYCRIWQLSSQGGTKSQLTSVPSHEQTALLTDDDVQMYKQQCSRGRQLQTLLHQFDDSAINMQVIEAYIGTVSSGTQCTGEDSSSLLSAVTCSETTPLERQVSDTPLTSLKSDMTKLTRDIAALGIIRSSSEKQQTSVLELEALKGENSNLQLQVVSLREADSRLQDNMDTFQLNVEEIRGDFSTLQKDITNMKHELQAIKAINLKLLSIQQNMDTFQLNFEKNRGDISNVQKDITNMEHELQAIKAINLKLQNDVDSSQQESLLIKTETKKLQDAADELSKDFKTFKASSLVAFNASLHEDSKAGSVILSKVHCNVGQAYDNTTGIFTVPVTGIYFFMARAMVAEKPWRFYLQIMVDGFPAAMSGSFFEKQHHGINYTVHLVQRLMKGQKSFAHPVQSLKTIQVLSTCAV
ncbi:uncharacterized protein LOC112565772 isoform X2 [Pomacea canaliculata]|uniref:uncharacterized protein LOC112565772 isoform X2 n=1 Tax=Pomacea canaliculata TaxID=400727 RepID=UPI000D72EE76|nr:uncharacterized protein LOC112565772 isoform X2 [Pomacea canaliculata]